MTKQNDAGWMPIETAPKDGEPILIWKPNERTFGEYLLTAYWDPEHWTGREGWVATGGHNILGSVSSITSARHGFPTHWMPLPAPPQLESTDQ